MNRTQTLTRGLAIMATLALLAGCATPATPTPAPTFDSASLQTQIAGSIFAQLTAAVTPTVPPTATAIPSNTPRPSATPRPTETPTEEAAATDTSLAAPAATRAQVPDSPTAEQQHTGDYALYQYTTPADGYQVQPNVKFNISWGFKNIGTTTWTAGTYKLVWVGGEHFTDVSQIPLDHDVKPGEKAEFTLGAFGSEDMSKHTTRWQLVNGRGLPIPGGQVYFFYQPV